jgi:hypothetical protein
MIKWYPGALKERNVYGIFPLHLACSDKLLEPVIPVMIQKFPQALGIKTKKAQYPLHVACLNELSDKLIFMLYHGNTGIAREKDKFGMIPSNYIAHIRYKAYTWLLKNTDKYWENMTIVEQINGESPAR